MSAADFKLRFWIARYLAGDVSVADFRRWFLPFVWELAEPGGVESRLARRVELRLAEYMNGHWTEQDLRTIFGELAPATSGIAADVAVGGPGSQRGVDNVSVDRAFASA